MHPSPGTTPCPASSPGATPSAPISISPRPRCCRGCAGPKASHRSSGECHPVAKECSPTNQRSHSLSSVLDLSHFWGFSHFSGKPIWWFGLPIHSGSETWNAKRGPPIAWFYRAITIGHNLFVPRDLGKWRMLTPIWAIYVCVAYFQ